MIFGLANAEGASLISGVSGLLGGALSGYSSSKAAKEYNKGQMELAQYQFDRNLDMWNLQNQYNSPIAQMQRYKDAGLNPYLIYGQGSNGNATGAPQFSLPHQVPNSKADAINQTTTAITNALSQYLSLQQQDKQNELLNEQIKQQRLQNTKSNIENDYLDKYLSARNASAAWDEILKWQNSQYFGAIKQSMIDNLLSENNYNNWYRDWNKGYLQRSEGREDKRIAMSLKQMLANIAHMQAADYRASQLLPYQVQSLKYNSFNAMMNALNNADDILHPLGRIGINTPFGRFNIGDVAPTVRKLLKSMGSMFPGYRNGPLELFDYLY